MMTNRLRNAHYIHWLGRGTALLLAVSLLSACSLGANPPAASGLPASPTPPPVPSRVAGVTPSAPPGEASVSPTGASPESPPENSPAPAETASQDVTIPAPSPTIQPPTAAPTPTGMPTIVPTPEMVESPAGTATLIPGRVLDHSGSGPGRTPTVSLEVGVYRVFVRSAGDFGQVGPVVEQGTCSTYPFFTAVSGPFEGSVTYRSTGCRVYFQMADAAGGWSIIVETATQNDLLIPPLTFNGDQPAATGLVDLQAGDYRMTFETESPFGLVVPVVAYGLCLERPIFIVTEAGRYEETYTSTGCQIVFQVSQVTAHWELSITPGPFPAED